MDLSESRDLHRVREELLEYGFYLSKSYGIRKITASKLAKACRIDKEELLMIFPSMDDFILAMSECAGEKASELFNNRLNAAGKLSTDEFFGFLNDFLDSNYNLLNGVELPDFIWLKEHFKSAGIFLPEIQITELRKAVDCISDKRSDIDCGILLNLIKCAYAMKAHRDIMYAPALDETFYVFEKGMKEYVRGEKNL